ncbi:sensor histidine kinase [Bacillus dakarensis]|uniref:sensor histidine kinase n=1 Tax=Robertmurraya dakarensis TaxID=1926278 RepID=UPI000980CDD9|nr:histidine kinase [Bacillus dakarensis]
MESLPSRNQISSYIIQSQEEEIKRIALELHEGVGQTLYSVFTGFQFLETSVEGDSLKGYIHEMGELLEKTIQEVRLLAVELHPPTLTTLGFIPALKSYLKLYTSTYGILVDFINDGTESRLPEHHRMTLFRVCQEALVNIAKYADSLQIEINVVWKSDCLEILVKDFGKGFDVDKEVQQSAGIAAMIERMKIIGGNCIISSVIGEGTVIKLFLPLQS